jgi:meso-butanediol dehydrogenase / (S,S)-butanediol dehydrogenase / diacetyl reductase
VVVTGGGHGIGRASAQRMGKEGAKLAVIDLRLDAADETVRLLADSGSDARAWAADVSADRDMADVIVEVLEQFGRIDVLHANAGVLIPGTVVSHTVDEWDKTFAVNVKGGFLSAQAVLPSMIEQREGSIIITASVSGMVGEPGVAAYDASKAALINLTRQMAIDYSRLGIRVNCVCPGWVETGFNDPALAHLSAEEIDQMIETWGPIGRQATAEDIAPCVAFLASDDARYVTGHALVADGGLTAA